MTSTPSVPQYMPYICQNIDVSRHVLVFRYIHDRANRMVENTTIRSYRCVCDSQMQRPRVIILLFEKKQTHVWEDECVRAPLLFLYNILLNSEYTFLWVARWCVREVPRDRFNASEKRTSLELATRFINFELVSRHIPNYSMLYCRPVHTDHNLNGFALRSVLVPHYIEFQTCSHRSQPKWFPT